MAGARTRNNKSCVALIVAARKPARLVLVLTPPAISPHSEIHGKKPTKDDRKSLMSHLQRSSAVACVLSAALTCAAVTPARAEDDVAAFYRDKTIRLFVGTGPGGGVDLVGRLLARHLHDHIPGSPNIVAQNMPGAGSLQMANYLANSGPRDGTAIGASLNGMPTAPLLQPKAARFDPTRLIWIGSVYRGNNVAYVWHASPVQSLEQLKT